MPHYGKIQTNHSLKYGRKLSIKFPQRWIKSGSPSPNLLFLGFNLATKRPHLRIGSYSNMR